MRTHDLNPIELAKVGLIKDHLSQHTIKFSSSGNKSPLDSYTSIEEYLLLRGFPVRLIQSKTTQMLPQRCFQNAESLVIMDPVRYLYMGGGVRTSMIDVTDMSMISLDMLGYTIRISNAIWMLHLM